MDSDAHTARHLEVESRKFDTFDSFRHGSPPHMRQGFAGTGPASASGLRSLDQVLLGVSDYDVTEGRHGKVTAKLRSAILKGHKTGSAITCMDTRNDM